MRYESAYEEDYDYEYSLMTDICKTDNMTDEMFEKFKFLFESYPIPRNKRDFYWMSIEKNQVVSDYLLKCGHGPDNDKEIDVHIICSIEICHRENLRLYSKYYKLTEEIISEVDSNYINQIVQIPVRKAYEFFKNQCIMQDRTRKIERIKSKIQIKKEMKDSFLKRI